ncbi:hypothetical protein [Priestia megaterium]|uniref:hypothetical protein n=1 Tax=Priestia megaterium TaxID=1404 RepID=UPI00366E8515
MTTEKTLDDRSGLIKGSMGKAFFELSQGYNSDHLQGIQYFDTANYNGVRFGVWVFEDGTFFNEGDGEYDNWTFRGRFERIGDNEKTINSHRP